MKETDKFYTCALGDSEFARVRRLVNTVFNVFGIMFFVTFLGYIAIHCL